MSRVVYIVIDKELGCNNICGVYSTEADAIKAFESKGGSTYSYEEYLLEEEFYE
jgi:hypothetical protein